MISNQDCGAKRKNISPLRGTEKTPEKDGKMIRLEENSAVKPPFKHHEMDGMLDKETRELIADYLTRVQPALNVKKFIAKIRDHIVEFEEEMEGEPTALVIICELAKHKILSNNLNFHRTEDENEATSLYAFMETDGPRWPKDVMIDENRTSTKFKEALEKLGSNDGSIKGLQEGMQQLINMIGDMKTENQTFKKDTNETVGSHRDRITALERQTVKKMFEEEKNNLLVSDLDIGKSISLGWQIGREAKIKMLENWSNKNGDEAGRQGSAVTMRDFAESNYLHIHRAIRSANFAALAKATKDIGGKHMCLILVTFATSDQKEAVRNNQKDLGCKMRDSVHSSFRNQKTEVSKMATTYLKIDEKSTWLNIKPRLGRSDDDVRWAISTKPSDKSGRWSTRLTIPVLPSQNYGWLKNQEAREEWFRHNVKSDEN